MQAGSADRYFQQQGQQAAKLVQASKAWSRIEEARGGIFQLVGGIRAGMGYLGAATLEALRANARFHRISGAGMRESHVHDVTVTKEPPNYRT